MSIYLATNSDFNIINQINIPYSFKNSIKTELSKQDTFRWIIKVNEDKVVAYHRSIIIEKWGFLAGVFVDPSNTDPWLLHKILNYSIKDLHLKGCIGAIAWDDAYATSKAKALKRFNFNKYDLLINRMIFDRESIEKMLENNSKKQGWRYSLKSDIKEIINLANFDNSFISELSSFPNNNNIDWLVLDCEDGIKAAINWRVHNEILEINFTLSKTQELDIFEGILALLERNHNKDLKMLRVNIESSRNITTLRLLSNKPKFYSNNFQNICLIKKFN